MKGLISELQDDHYPLPIYIIGRAAADQEAAGLPAESTV